VQSPGGRRANTLSDKCSHGAGNATGFRLDECAMFARFAAGCLLMTVSLSPVVAEEFGAMITRVDGNNVTFHKTQFKKGEKPRKGKAITLPARNAKVYKAKIQFNKEKKKIEILAGEPLERGLKNEAFTELTGKASIAARITTAKDNKSITRILVLKSGGKKKPAD
jgi:hypothetical protein